MSRLWAYTPAGGWSILWREW